MNDELEPQDATLADVRAPGPVVQAMSRQVQLIRRLYPDLERVSVDFLFYCFLTLHSRFGRFSFGPISIDCRLIEEQFERKYKRVAPGEAPGPQDESANRFYRKLAEELTRSGRRHVDELHWLLAFMRTDEGLPASVFGELGIAPEAVEGYARGDAPDASRVPANRAETAELNPPETQRRAPAERLYTPEEVADYLGVHVQTVRIWIRTGKLPARKLAGQRALRIRESDLEAVLEPVDVSKGDGTEGAT